MKINVVPRFPFMAVFLILFAVTSAQAAEMVAKSYDIKNVSELVVSGGGRVQIVQGETESLRVEAEQNVIDRVSVDLSGNKLTLGVKYSSQKSFSFFHLFYNHHDDDVLYVVQLKNLHYLGLSGATRATLGNWVGSNMALNIGGAGDVTFANLKLDDLYIELSGASNAYLQQLLVTKAKFELSGAANANIKATGEAKFLQVGASGASNFRGKLLTVAQAEVGASGASNIDLRVTEFLKASASGASNVHYLGMPKVQSDASGASHVNSISD